MKICLWLFEGIISVAFFQIFIRSIFAQLESHYTWDLDATFSFHVSKMCACYF